VCIVIIMLNIYWRRPNNSCSARRHLLYYFVECWCQHNVNLSATMECCQYFMYHPYFDDVNISKFRISLSQLRMLSHRLCIETGRWHRPNQTPISERICHACSTLEDEYHFVMECSLYINLWKKIIPSYYWKRPVCLSLLTC